MPFLIRELRDEAWGYNEDSLLKIKDYGLEKGIFTDIKRHRFWINGVTDDKIDAIRLYLEKKKIQDIDKYIVVCAENNSQTPYFAREFNFIHIDDF